MNSDLVIIAKTLYSEARGEGNIGLQAVATVICNRAKNKTENMAAICIKPKQFSCWNNVDDIAIKEQSLYRICLRIAETMLDKTFIPYPFKTIKPTNYLTYSLYMSDKCPNWARGVAGEIIGNHIFLQLKR